MYTNSKLKYKLTDNTNTKLNIVQGYVSMYKKVLHKVHLCKFEEKIDNYLRFIIAYATSW